MSATPKTIEELIAENVAMKVSLASCDLAIERLTEQRDKAVSSLRRSSDAIGAGFGDGQNNQIKREAAKVILEIEANP